MVNLFLSHKAKAGYTLPNQEELIHSCEVCS